MTEQLTVHENKTQSTARASLREKLDDKNTSLADVLSEIGLEGLTSDERLSLLEHATVNDYMGAVDVIHRKVAPEESHDPHPEPVKIADPKTGEVRSYTARPDERRGIMTYALELIQQLARKYRQEGGSIEDVLQRCGNLAAFGIVLAHNYEDGNGRTARTISELIHKGFDASDPESKANIATLSANRPEKGYRVNSYVPSGDWGQGRANEYPTAFLDSVAAVDISLDGQSYAIELKGKFTTPRMA